MTIAKWCLLGAFALPILSVGLAKAASLKRGPGADLYDNHRPREWVARQTGWQARAHAAQANGFEILPLFVAAVLLAQMAQADQARIDQLALAFLGLRLVYGALYLMNLATLRTLVWGLSVTVCVALLAMAA
jgi:uncharacterized MAPEG superfamily protein